MRAFITALLAAVAIAGNKTKPIGGYDYRQGGSNWGTLYPDMEGNVCGDATKKEQSPVDLLTTGAAVVADKDLNIQVEGLGKNAVDARDKATTNMEVNWHHNFGSWADDATVTRTDGSTKAETFQPVQIHWHTPSENTVDGKHYAAEAHIVSQATDGTYAVIGLFFDNVGQDTDNDFVKSFFAAYDDRFNTDAATKKTVDMDLATRKVVEEDGFWQFMGSFTTPPCTEGVKWTVMKTVQNISTSQLDKFFQFTKGTATGNEANATEAEYLTNVQTNTANANNAAGNNRAVQPLNSRKLYWKNNDTTANGVDNVDYTKTEEDAASTMMASAFTAAAVTFLSF